MTFLLSSAALAERGPSTTLSTSLSVRFCHTCATATEAAAAAAAGQGAKGEGGVQPTHNRQVYTSVGHACTTTSKATAAAEDGQAE